MPDLAAGDVPVELFGSWTSSAKLDPLAIMQHAKGVPTRA